MTDTSANGHSPHTTPIQLPAGSMEKLWQFPLVLYRMGLGPALGRVMLVLSTRGRRTGLWRHVPVAYTRDGDDIYIVSSRGERADWYRNLEAHPEATLQIGNWRFAATAEFLTDQQDLRAMAEAIRAYNPRFVEVTRGMLGVDLNKDEELTRLTAVRFTPSGYPPQGDFTTDLMWLWLIIIPVALWALRQVLKRPKMLVALAGQAMPLVVWALRQYMSQQQAQRDQIRVV
ncbi:MAG: nitroreductase family deazaflavin-dependent oxidoreductase [Anaerolineae bacterium]|nr:nitroreductase family deazaflavin-dependent oxidoreductase [Anaerolineae bacterium]